MIGRTIGLGNFMRIWEQSHVHQANFAWQVTAGGLDGETVYRKWGQPSYQLCLFPGAVVSPFSQRATHLVSIQLTIMGLINILNEGRILTFGGPVFS